MQVSSRGGRYLWADGLAVALLLLGSGCQAIVGDYGIADGLPSCGDSEVPSAGGDCVTIGAAGDCGDLFERDPDRPGACQPVAPDCPAGSINGLRNDGCDFTWYCSVPPPQGTSASDFYVDDDASPGGRGTRDAPFRSIAEALQAGADIGGTLVTIHLFEGTYRESVHVDRPVAIVGYCSDQTIIRGDANAPVVELVGDPSITGQFKLANVTLQSGGTHPALRIDGVSDFDVGTVFIDGADGPGVSVEQRSGPTSGSLSGLVVRRATDAGIELNGVSGVTISKSRIVDTRPGGTGRGIGIVVGPAARIGEIVPDGYPGTLANRPRSTNVVVEETRITNSRGAGLRLEGSDATLTRVLVEGTGRDREGRARGIEAVRGLLGDLDAELTVQQSVIRRNVGIGIHVEDVNAVVDRTSIVDGGVDGDDTGVFGDAVSAFDETGCPANGVRARAVWLANGAVPGLEITDSAISGVTDAGIHVEAAKATIVRTIVRGVEPDRCTGSFGDGVAVYGYPELAQPVTRLKSVLVDAAARAGVAAWRAPLGSDGALAVGAKAQTPLSLVDGAALDGQILCENGDGWRVCAATRDPLSPSLRAYPQCNPDDEVCFDQCFRELGSVGSGAPAILRAVGWDPARPGIARYSTDPDGCVRGYGGSGQASRSHGWHWSPGYTATNAETTAQMAQGPAVVGFNEMVGEAGGAAQEGLLGREPPDYRNGMFVPFGICDPPTGPVEQTTELCLGHGVQGASGELLSADGQPLSEAWAEAYYFGEQNVIGQPGVHVTTSNAYGYFYDVPPGEYRVRLSPPAGHTWSCDLDPTNTGIEVGWPVAGETDTYRVFVEPGVTSVAVRVFCSVE